MVVLFETELPYLQNCQTKNDLNTLPNDKILDQSKLKAFVDGKSKVVQMAKFVLDKIENIVGKEEKADYQHFLFSYNVFKRLLSQGH